MKQYTYLSLGCSKAQEHRMLNYAKRQVGKPFSNIGMARSLIFPRTTTGESWFCAELVAKILQEGGLLSSDSNPSAATPYSLYKLYSNKAAATANPFILRSNEALNFTSIVSSSPTTTTTTAPIHAPPARPGRAVATGRKRDESPPRAQFRLLREQQQMVPCGQPGLTLRLDSLR